jgi:DDB1- and CUL4-associated factor 13
MKIKTISRSEEKETRSSRREIYKVHKNPDPKLHPFEKAKEYTRAVKAMKLDKIFAKPFLGALSEHKDGIYSSAVSPKSLVAFVSGAADGEIIVSDLASRRKLWSIYGHNGFVRGLSIAGDGETFVSCGQDKSIKLWKLAAQESLAASTNVLKSKRLRAEEESSNVVVDSRNPYSIEPSQTWTGLHAFMYLDHNLYSSTFATSSTVVDVWDYNRSIPIHTFEWGSETVTTVKWNLAEKTILASTGNDRCVALYDTRMDVPLRKVQMSSVANAVAWNPREPMNFTLASEDTRLYTFDMRSLSKALMVHKDHVGPVMDVAYSPTGREFVSGSYDKTVRLWRVDAGSSREVYHTKRMQRVFTVKYTNDAKYVISGSDDANIRIWKARASEPLGRLMPRQRAAMDYANALKKRYAHLPEVARIAHQQHIPRAVVKAKAAVHLQDQKERKKLANIRAHTKEDSLEGKVVSDRKKFIRSEIK